MKQSLNTQDRNLIYNNNHFGLIQVWWGVLANIWPLNVTLSFPNKKKLMSWVSQDRNIERNNTRDHPFDDMLLVLDIGSSKTEVVMGSYFIGCKIKQIFFVQYLEMSKSLYLKAHKLFELNGVNILNVVWLFWEDSSHPFYI